MSRDLTIFKIVVKTATFSRNRDSFTIKHLFAPRLPGGGRSRFDAKVGWSGRKWAKLRAKKKTGRKVERRDDFQPEVNKNYDSSASVENERDRWLLRYSYAAPVHFPSYILHLTYLLFFIFYPYISFLSISFDFRLY